MFDILIKNGTICDGTGEPCYKADIGIEGDRITYIGTDPAKTAEAVIDAEGKTITPGFIDTHTHADLSLLMEPAMEPFVKQGVTTVVTGNCGYSMAPQGDETFYCFSMNQKYQELAGADSGDPLPLIYERKQAAEAFEKMYGVKADWKTFKEYNSLCDKGPLGCNVAPLVGYSAVRTAVMGKDCCREATEDEVRRMEQAVEDAMQEGAFGMSTGRDPAYLPGPFATDEEIHKMVKIVAKHGGVFASHTANYDDEGRENRMGGYEEMLRQAEGTGVKVHVSHVHVMNMAADEKGAAQAAEKTLAYFDRAKDSGVDLTFDVIPSPSCCNFTLTSFGYYLKPLVLMAGGQKELAELWQTEAFRKKLYNMLEEGQLPALDINAEDNLLAELCVLKHKNPLYVGKYIPQCAEIMGKEPFDAAMEMFCEDLEMVADFIAPVLGDSVDILCRSDYAMPCSDGFGFSKETNLTGCDEAPAYPNSMNIGLIPRYLTRYGGGDFEKAVYKASGLPAQRFGIEKRGVLKEGNFADLVILDRDNLHSFDEEENPLQDPEGISYVLVNGKVAFGPDGLAKNGTGRILRKTI